MREAITRLGKPSIVAIVSQQPVGYSAKVIACHQGIDVTHQGLDNTLGQLDFGRHREYRVNELAVFTRVI